MISIGVFHIYTGARGYNVVCTDTHVRLCLKLGGAVPKASTYSIRIDEDSFESHSRPGAGTHPGNNPSRWGGSGFPNLLPRGLQRESYHYTKTSCGGKMATSERVYVNLEHMEGGNGTLAMALQLWSCRNGPVQHNKLQSFYFTLCRDGYRDEEAVAGESADEKQQIMREQHVHSHKELHGPDYLAQALLSTKNPIQETAMVRQEHGHDADRSLSDRGRDRAEEYATCTPRARQAAPAEPSPDYLL